MSTSRPDPAGSFADVRTLSRAFGRAFVFLTLEGVIVELSDAAAKVFGKEGPSLAKRRLLDLVANPDTTQAYLRAWGRSTQPVPGAISLATAKGSREKYNCLGVRCHVSLSESPLIALLIEPKQESVEHFTLLNRQLERLSTEIGRRQRIEASLVEQQALLREAMARLEESDRRKDEFLATLAHELRNPLAPIRNAAAALRLTGDKPVPPEAWRIIDRQIGVMARLIDDLLDASRVSTGRLVLQKQKIDLTVVLKHAMEISMPLIESAGHELAVRFPSQAAVLDGDPVRLSQIFANLLNNAAKYTTPGGKIQLYAQNDDGHATVQVTDNGRGIPPAMLDEIFDMFRQVEKTLERSQGGLGIGLSLAKSLTELHGGTIVARSEGAGKGSTFIVRLPRAAGARPAPASSAASDSRLSAKRVLIADDNHDGVQSLALLLGLAGHEVYTASNGEEAVEQFARHAPEVVLLDIGMPRLNGYEAAQRIRSTAAGAAATLIAITGWGQEEDKRRALDAGFDAHLVKPVTLEQLEDLLRARL